MLLHSPLPHFPHLRLPFQRKIFVKEAEKLPPCNNAYDFEVDTLSLLTQIPKYQGISAGRASRQTFSVQSAVLKS